MVRFSALFVLLPLLAACTARDLTGPETPDQTAAVNARITYEVDGTYAACDLTFTHPISGTVTRNGTTLPWTLSFQVKVDEKTGPFDAILQATCTDDERLGKASLILLVGDEVKSRGAATGPGATSVVTFRVGEDT